MNLAGLKSGAILAGVTIGGGALVGAGIGAVRSLNDEPNAATSGFTGMEKRSVLANAIIGAGVGALGGYVWSQRMEEQKRRMEQATQGTGVDVTQTSDNQLKLNIPSDISFDLSLIHI